ncbi:MAG: hypothetical protein A2808_00855 [Candidatus Moranbacteria bacterium RIFCSPHIGHO2_01_FULL_55_24]|nr:MAG: hypothetical protein A2808_00855 [Candidatus Moranbacteria bacterium RIFCSPHIGHO2_01_FULL_55_24]
MHFSKRTFLEVLLRLMARAVLAKYHPIIVGVTGSVGKSSAKEAIALVLAHSYRVRKSEGNYNNEIGIPLTILGEKSGGRSLIRWALILFRFIGTLVLPRRYPEVLVLEMGIDHPGDMDYLLSFVPVNIGVATHISGSHMAYFGSIANIAREKGRLIAKLPEDGFAILNADDKRILKMAERTRAKIITYGFSEGADLRADNLLFYGDARRADGYSLKLNHSGKTIPLRLPSIIARHHIPAALAGAAVGIALKMNLVEIASALENFEPLPGRLSLFPGRNDTVLLDDTYNASPASTRAALQVLQEMSAPRKLAVLGDMLELGPDSDNEHAALAPDIMHAGVHMLVLVGKHMRALHDALLEEGFARKQLLWLPDPYAAIEAMQQIIRPGDLILIKGSQGLRMEFIVEQLLREPGIAPERLCRQSAAWKNKRFAPPEEWTEELKI